MSFHASFVCSGVKMAEPVFITILYVQYEITAVSIILLKRLCSDINMCLLVFVH